MSELRKSGIDVLGEMPWGSHFCNFYETKQDLLEILIPYFKAGLDNNEFCLWAVPDPEIITEKEAKAALKKVVPDLNQYLADGKIEILGGPEWYLRENEFNTKRVISAWDAKLKRALALGYDGMRVSGDTFWLSEKNWTDFYTYEKRLNDSVIGVPMIVLCTYPFSRVGAAEIFDIAQVHQFAIARRKGNWEIVENAVQLQAQAEIRRLNKELQQLKIKRPRHPEILNYMVAVLSVTVALIVAQFLDVYLVTAPVSLFICALMFSAWYGGLKPGLLSVVLSLLVFKFFFVSPIYSLTVDVIEAPRLIFFILSGLFVVWLSAVQRNATESLGNARDILEGTVQKLQQTNATLQEEVETRKKSELQTIREKELSNEIIDSIPAVFMVLDEHFRFLRWNKNVELVSGYTASEIPGLHAVNDFYEDADERKKVQSLMDQAFEKGTIHGEASPRTKGGKRTCFYFNARLINYEGKRCIICTAIDITERKQAEDALRKSEDRLRLITDTIPALVWSALPDGSIDFINQRHQEFTGLSLDDVGGWRWTAVIHPDDRARVVEEWRRSLATSEALETETRLRRAYGDYRWLLIRAVPLRDESGTINKWYGTKTDITERKEAEDALRRSEDQIRLIIDTIPIMAWSVRPDGTIDFVNQRWQDYAGLTLDQEVEDPTRIVHPQDLQTVLKKWSANMAEGKPSEDEMRLKRADGIYRWFLVRTAPLRDEQGNVVKWYGVSTDIENSKQAENELRLAYQRLVYHVENTPLAVIELDKDLFIKRWSKRAEEIFGWKTSEALGKNVHDPDFPIIYEEDIKAVNKINEQLVKGMVDRNLSLNRNYTRDGQLIYCEWYNSVLRDEQGNVITILSLVDNVTERKISEEQIRQSESHLAEAQRLAKLGSWDYDFKADRLTWSEELYNVFDTDKRIFQETHDSFLNLVDKEDREFALQTSKHTQQTGEPFTIEYHITTSKGEKKVIQEHGYGQKDGKGNVVRLFGTAQDITERKKAEETLKQSYEEIKRLTEHLQKIREEERTFIAREIHDELGQQLTAIKMDVVWIDKKIPEGTAPIKSKLKNIIELLDGSNQSVRKILSELRSGILGDHGLPEALKWQGRQFTERTGIPVEFTITEEALKLPEEIAASIFRVYQESLTNIMRHAEARKVLTSLKILDNFIIVSIEDDGKGFYVESLRNNKSFGILGMKERIASVHGKFEVDSVPGKGTTINISIPYNANNN